MKLYISHFRNYESASFTLTSGLNLISGPSGIGKTTIFNALYWLLYGKLRGVNPMGLPNRKTLVRLETSSSTIQRERNPGKLTLVINSGTYTEEAAQAWINSHWGPMDMFLSSSYLQQKEKVHLLNLSNTEKFDLLNWLSFSGDSPSMYIEKIELAAKKYASEYHTNKALFEAGQTWLNSELAKYPVKYPSVTSEDIKVSQDQIQNLIRESSTLSTQLEQYSKTRQQIGQLTLVLNQKEVELSTLKISSIPIIPDDIINLKRQIMELMPQQKIYTSRQWLEKEMSKLSYPKDITTVKVEDILTYNQNRTVCSKYSLDYTPEIYAWVDTLISNYQSYQQYLGVSNQQKQLDFLLQKEKDLISKINPITLPSNARSILESKGRIERYRELLKLRGSKTLWSLSYLNKVMAHNNLEPETVLKVKKELDVLRTSRGSRRELEMQLHSYKCPTCSSVLFLREGTLKTIDTSLEQIGLDLERFTLLESKMSKYPPIDWDYLESKNCLLDREELVEQVRLTQIQKEMDTLYHTGFSTDVWTVLDLNELQSKLKEHTEQQQIERELNSVQSTIQSIKPYITSISPVEYRSEFDSVKKYAGWRAEIKKYVPDPKVTLDQWKSYSAYLNLKADLDKLPVITEDPTIELISKQKELTLLEHNFTLQKQTQAEYQRLQVEITQIKQNLETLPQMDDPRIKWQEATEALNTERVKLNELNTSFRLVSRRNELLDIHSRLMSLNTSYMSAQLLIKLGKELEQIRLNQIVSNFNHVVNAILSELFDCDIHFTASTTKVMKTTAVEKPSFDVKITLKGVESDFNSLSGGEKDRVSLAILIGLSTFSPSPIIMLDECLSSLDTEIKEKAISVIKNLTPTKPVIVIDHEINSGWFDSVINL